MKIEDLHTIEYMEAWDIQKRTFAEVLSNQTEDTLYLCEHPHVYTLGKNGNEKNMLVSEQFLKSVGATFHKIDRGGDITYHGPGQMVAYPILNIDRYGLSLKGYISLLEESIIQTVALWGISAGRKTGATGVWLSDGRGERKICAIGVKASHFVTMHGLALNVNTDLRYFSYINPCGFTDKGVTSIEAETGNRIDMDSVKKRFTEIFCSLLHRNSNPL